MGMEEKKLMRKMKKSRERRILKAAVVHTNLILKSTNIDAENR